jgi:hypothetical protein
MAYEARPTWRYQWSAIGIILVMLAVVAIAMLYGPGHIGPRITHLVFAAASAVAFYYLLLALYRRLFFGVADPMAVKTLAQRLQGSEPSESV